MAQYEVRMRCVVIKLVTVEAETAEEAVKRADHWDIVDEYDIEMPDWEIVSKAVLVD